MEALFALFCLGILAAVVAVICIAVSASGIKSQLENMMGMFTDRLLPGLDNLDKIRQQLEVMAASTSRSENKEAVDEGIPTDDPVPCSSQASETTAVGGSEPAASIATPITIPGEVPPPPSGLEQNSEEASYSSGGYFSEPIKPKAEGVWASVPSRLTRTPEPSDELPVSAHPDSEAGATPSPPDMSEILAALAENAQALKAGLRPSPTMAEPDDLPSMVSEEAAAEVEGAPVKEEPVPESLDLVAADNPADFLELSSTETLVNEPPQKSEQHQKAAPDDTAGPAEPEAPSEPSAFSQALDQILTNIVPVLKNLWRQGLNFLMKEGHIWVVTGVLMLLLGVSFFVRYSIAMGWFSPPLRLASSALLGFFIFSLGFRLRESRRGYGLLLQSCGLGVLYLTTVGAVRLYSLLASLPALAALTVLVALTATLALWQNAQLLAHVSLIAAFAAPLLVSQNSGNYVGLFSYYCVINTGILIMSFFRPWRRLYLTGFALTFGIFALWAKDSYQPEFFSKTIPFLVAFYLFYTLMGLRVSRQTQPMEGQELTRRRLMSTDMTLTILTPLVFLILAAYVAWNEPYVLAGCAFGLGLVYVILARLMLKSQQQEALQTASMFLSQGVIYANLALPLTFLSFKPDMFRPGWLMGLVWALEGAFIYRTGAAEGRVGSRFFGLLLIILAAALGVHTLLTVENLWPILSPTFLLTLIVAAGALLAADAADVHRRRLCPFEQKWPEFITAGAGLWLLGATLLEVISASAMFNLRHGLVWLLVAFTLEAGLLNLVRRLRPGLGALRRFPGRVPLLLTSAVWPALTAGLLAIFYLGPIISPQPGSLTALSGLELAAWAFYALLSLILLLERRPRDSGDKRGGLWLDHYRPLTVLIGLAGALAGGQILITIGWAVGLGSGWAEFLRLLPLAGLMAFMARREFIAGPQKPWLPVLIGLVCLWNFFALIGFAGQGFYLPFLNPLDFIQVVMIIPFSAWLYLHLKKTGALNEPHRVFYGLSVLLFIWINLVLGRLVHHWLGVTYAYQPIVGNDTFQSLAALTWGAIGIAAMITGHRARRRTQWLLGSILIGADVVKLFFIDLSQAETLTRVVSFICVGLLLILVGYFAPLPPKSSQEPES